MRILGGEIEKADIIPDTKDVLATVKQLINKEYFEKYAPGAGVAAICAFFMAKKFLTGMTKDKVGDMVEQLVSGTGVSILKNVLGESLLGETAALGLPALSGAGNAVSDWLVPTTDKTSLPTDEDLNKAAAVFAAAVFAGVYVKPLLGPQLKALHA